MRGFQDARDVCSALVVVIFFFFSSRRRHTRFDCDWSSDVCSSTSGSDAVSRRPPRLAVTLGDPRGIGPEVVAKALAPGLDAGITLIGADEQIADIPAQRKIGVGSWGGGAGSGEQGAGRLAGVAVEQAVALARDGVVDAIVTGDRKSTRLNSSHSQISYAVSLDRK